jgi:hypothetical protein
MKKLQLQRSVLSKNTFSLDLVVDLAFVGYIHVTFRFEIRSDYFDCIFSEKSLIL